MHFVGVRAHGLPCNTTVVRFRTVFLVPLVLAFAASCKSSSDKPTPPDAGIADGGAADDASSQDSGPARTGPLDPLYVDSAINHVILAGQSNALGIGTLQNTVLSTTQPATNLMFDVGVIPLAGCNGDGCLTYQTPSAFAPLVEGDQYGTTDFNYPVETPASGLASQASSLAKSVYQFGRHADYPMQHDLLVSNVARSGNSYTCLSKAGCNYHDASLLKPFTQLVSDVTAAQAIATSQGKSYVVRAVANVHGEADNDAYDAVPSSSEFPGLNGLADYGAGLVKWQSDFESTIKSVTKQAQPVPMFISQISGWTAAKASRVAQYQLDAHANAPGKVILVGPSYPFDIDPQDCLHFSSASSRRLGEYFAKAYAKVVLGGEVWEPVRPKAITRTGAVITVQFYVPKPPLVFDTTLVSEAANKGFLVTDGGGANETISEVAISGSDTVTITLAAAPSGSTTLSYAQNQLHPAARNANGELAPGTCSGPVDHGPERPAGARGNLHDSDDMVSASGGTPLVDWAVQFTTPVP